ncbi:MAG: hypothetical protein B7Y61_03100 [Rhizobiales bacterium 35-66-30]|nr:MAG: hypothetical protein B7Y61_03100 [Rhizobiales bacterium 35-66-30]
MSVYFNALVRDIRDKNENMRIEFGSSDEFGKRLMYIYIDGQAVTIKESLGRQIYSAMRTLGTDLGYADE